MKKFFVFFLIILSIVSIAQDKNKLMVDEKSGKQMLIGLCDRTAFADTNFSWWYKSGYDNYNPDTIAVKELKNKLSCVGIKVVMGSWCSDSRREVPRLYKILDVLGYDEKNLTLICVDRKKESPVGEVDKLDIKLVPTFIFYKNGEELGRIIESPKETLEKDLLKIVLK